MFLSSLRRILKRRQRSQGLVEYGIITACLAFAGLAGFNALAGAQKSYLQDYPRNATPPSAPGSLLHPTSVDLPLCNPPTNPIKAGTQVTCNTTVYDQYSDPYDRNPPLGTLNWWLDTTLIGSCALLPLPAVPPFPASRSACTAPALNWKADAAYIGQIKNLVAKYEFPITNHITSQSPSTQLMFSENLNFAVTCINDEFGWADKVEIGHPLRCTVTLTDLSSGSPVPAASKWVTWSTDNGASPGVAMFTCSTGYPVTLNIWSDPVNCPQPAIPPIGTASLACTTNVNGQCAVIYRRLFDSSGGGAPLIAPPLTLQASMSTSPPYTKINVITAGTLHPTVAVPPVCVRKSGSAASTPLGTFVVGNAKFQQTQEIDITGGSATFDCTIIVIDASPNPALTYSKPAPDGNPDRGEAHPPTGIVHVVINGTGYGCSGPLVRADMISAPVLVTQAFGQAPFASTCTVLGVPMSGAVPSTEPLIVQYPGDVAHLSSDSNPIQVNFNP